MSTLCVAGRAAGARWRPCPATTRWVQLHTEGSTPPAAFPRKYSPSAPENSIFCPFWACGANFFAHEARQHGDVETNNTTAHPQQGSFETTITTAPEKCTKYTHFAPAKAMAVSDDRPTRTTGAGCGARGRRRHHRQPNFARNLSRSFFKILEKRCNPNDVNAVFE